MRSTTKTKTRTTTLKGWMATALGVGIWLGAAQSGAQEGPNADGVGVLVRIRAGGVFGPTTMVVGGGIDTPVHQVDVQVDGAAGSLVTVSMTGTKGHTTKS